jgi:hypothetical protein
LRTAGPIDAVQARVVEEVAHLPPALAEHLLPLGFPVEVHLQPGQVQRLADGDGGFRQVDDRVLAVLRDQHLLPVGENLVPADRPEPGFLPATEVEHVELRRAAGGAALVVQQVAGGLEVAVVRGRPRERDHPPAQPVQIDLHSAGPSFFSSFFGSGFGSVGSSSSFGLSGLGVPFASVTR